MSKFTSDSTLKEILSFPKGAGILDLHEVPCLTCPMANVESDYLTIGVIADAYDLDLDAILKDLNK